MDKISVVIIAFNEERGIAKTLESVKEIADEIVVVDSFSTDKTEEICKKYGCVFIKHTFENYISQKNYALSCASNKMVLSLDADEELSPELKKSILDEKKKGLKNYYSMNRLTRVGENWIKHSGWYPDRKLRLFNKEIAHWGGMNPHDEVIAEKDEKINHLKGDLLHHSFFSFEELKKQSERFAKLGAQAYFEKGKKSGLIKIIASPTLRFIRDYFFNRGVFYGSVGFKICVNNSHSTWLKYKYLNNLYKNSKHK